MMNRFFDTKSLMTIGLGLIAAVTMSAVSAVVTSAATQSEGRESITLSPVNKQYELDAGETVKGELTVVNDGAVAFDFIVYAQPYSITNPEYEPSFTATPENSDAYKWVTFAEDKWRLDAGKTVKIPYTIQVPENAAPGGHYGVLFAETQPVAPENGSVARKKRVGSIIYATVNGNYERGGEIASVTIPHYVSAAPLTALTTINNTGNTHFLADSTLRVKDILGNVKYKLDKQHFVLPQTSRDITLSWDKAPWFGVYQVEVVTNFLSKSQTTSGYVLIAPYWLLIAFVVAIAVALWYSVKRR